MMFQDRESLHRNTGVGLARRHVGQVNRRLALSLGQQYYAMEMLAFANGRSTILEIYDAVRAEYGLLDLACVIQFFETAEKSGEFELIRR